MTIKHLFKLLLTALDKKRDKEIGDMLRFNKYTAKPWKYIIIHHSATPDGKTYDWDAICKYHVETKKWSNCGYHIGLEYSEQERGYVLCMGRPMDRIGAHTRGMNTKALGICLVGNYDEVEPTEAQYWNLASICRNLMRTFYIPIENIKMHSDYSKKTCPGKKFNLSRLILTIRGKRTL